MLSFQGKTHFKLVNWNVFVGFFFFGLWIQDNFFQDKKFHLYTFWLMGVKCYLEYLF